MEPQAVSENRVINNSNDSNPVGRPSVITEEVIRKLEAAFQNGMSDKTACQYARISADTFYSHLKSNQRFSDRITSSKNFLKLLAGKRLAHILNKGSDRDAVPLVKFTLEKLEPEQFGEKDGVTINQSFQYKDPDWFVAPQDIVDGQLVSESSALTMAAEMVTTTEEITMELV